MRISTMVWREIMQRKGSFAAGIAAATIAAAVLAGSLTAMQAHDLRTTRVLNEQRDALRQRLVDLDRDIEQAMRHLGYAFSIVPADQNVADWYATDYASVFLPQSAVERLANSTNALGRVALLPRLRQKITWPEKNWTVLLVGQGVPTGNTPPPATLSVASGQCALGHELHASLDLREGQSIRFMTNTFTISTCQPETGSKDDVTVTLSLADAQRLLGKPDAISEILLYQPGPTVESIERLRSQVPVVVPGSRLLGNASHVTASLMARRDISRDGEATIAAEREHRKTMGSQRKRLLSLIIGVSLLVSVVWLFLLAHANVRRRAEEVGVLRTLGYSTSQILRLLLTRGLATGIIGGAAGTLIGVAAATNGNAAGCGRVVLVAFVAAILASLVGGGIPAWLGIQMDPAERLRGT